MDRQQWAADNDAVLLDVREPSEWKQGTLPGSMLISMSEITGRLDEIPNDRAILCICRSGSRSNQVAAFLAFNGHDHVANMAGGLHKIGMQD